MANFQRLATDVEAVQILSVAPEAGEAMFSEHPGWLEDAMAEGAVSLTSAHKTELTHWSIRAFGVPQLAAPGDWIVRNSKGALYPVSAELFKRLYIPELPEA